MKIATADRIVHTIFWIIVAMAIYFGGRAVGGRTVLPAHFYEAPLALSPIVTIIVSLIVFVEYVENEWGSKKAHFFASISMVVGCMALSISTQWWQHLLAMLFIFAVFCCWDVAMILNDGLDEKVKKEVSWGHLHINLPTYGSILVAGLYLAGGKLCGWLDINVPQDIGAHYAALVAHNGHLLNPLEMFTTGLIAFHLVVAGISYLAVTYGKEGKVEAYYGRKFTR